MEWLFSWEVSSVVVVLFIGIALAVLALADFKLAKLFFLLAAADASGEILMWGIKTQRPLLQQIVLVFLLIGSTGVIAVLAFNYVDKKAEAKRQPAPQVSFSPLLKFLASAIAAAHLPDDNLGGFLWSDPRFVDLRLQITNSGVLAQNLTIQIRTGHWFWHIFELDHFPGVTLRLVDPSGPGGMVLGGLDQNGHPIFIQPSEISFSSDAEIRCESLDNGQTIIVGFAVTPREMNPKGPRSIPERVDVKGSFDKRTSGGGLERVSIPATQVAVIKGDL